MLRSRHYPYDNYLISHIYPASLSTAANLSLIQSFTMVEYTNTEYTNMVLVYGKVAGDVRAARRIYQECYLHHVTPLHTLFTKVIQWLWERGTYRADCGAPRKHHTPNFDEDILYPVEETSSTST